MKIKWTKVRETRRTYHWAGHYVEFANVIRIEVRKSGKHRIETASGRKAFVAPGWLWLDIVADAWTF